MPSLSSALHVRKAHCRTPSTRLPSQPASLEHQPWEYSPVGPPFPVPLPLQLPSQPASLEPHPWEYSPVRPPCPSHCVPSVCAAPSASPACWPEICGAVDHRFLLRLRVGPGFVPSALLACERRCNPSPGCIALQHERHRGASFGPVLVAPCLVAVHSAAARKWKRARGQEEEREDKGERTEI